MRAGLLAAVLLLAACAGASPTPSTDPVRILAHGLGGDAEPFLVHVALTNDDYVDGWPKVGWDGPPPPRVDFATEVAIYLGMAGSSGCPTTFLHLVVDADAAHVYAEWDDNTNKNIACTDDLAPQGIALAVSRAVLPAGEFRLTLRSDLMCPDCPDHPDQETVTVR